MDRNRRPKAETGVYPIPETSIPQGDQCQEDPPYGGFFIETPPSQDGLDQSIQSTSSPKTRHSRLCSELSINSLSPRTWGRTRQDVAGVLDEDPEEVRTKYP